MKKRHFVIIAILLTGAVAYIGNASWLVPSMKEHREILAHRGLHQTFDPVGVTNKTCTASRIHKPTHAYIENTLESIQAAVKLGANVIEFDVHPTTDGEFMVFHDWTLECRTNGEGAVRDRTSVYLKQLDIGYGYTADGGRTFPFRGKHVGAMPTLNEVLTKFPKVKFLINIKSSSKEEARKLTNYLKKTGTANRTRLSVLGSGEAVAEFSRLNGDIKILSKQQAKTCLKSYVLLGWSGYISQSCHNSFVPVPENYQWLIWGWPNRFESRLMKVGSRSVLMGPHKKGKANSGIDNIQMIKNIPSDYGGIVFTNRIDLIGKMHSEETTSLIRPITIARTISVWAGPH
jgi:glycerophosphoryl diester phosphodiesterase